MIHTCKLTATYTSTHMPAWGNIFLLCMHLHTCTFTISKKVGNSAKLKAKWLFGKFCPILSEWHLVRMSAPSTFTISITGVHTMMNKNLFTISKIYYIQVCTIPQVFSDNKQKVLVYHKWNFLYTRYKVGSTACVFDSEIKLWTWTLNAQAAHLYRFWYLMFNA